MSWQKIVLYGLGITALTAVVIVALLRDKIINSPQWQITAIGRGEVEYVPDQAIVTLGYNVERDFDAASALRNLNSKIEAIIKAVEDKGISRENITTQTYSLSQRYDYINGESLPNGYQANQLITITIDNVDENLNYPSEIIEAASTAGANQVVSVTFGVEDTEVLKSEARNMAIEKAKQRAQEMEGELDIKLGDVVGIWENVLYNPEPTPVYYGGYGAGGGGGPVVPQGTNKYILEVNLNYKLK
jgi:uncharacterized protein YggE